MQVTLLVYSGHGVAMLSLQKGCVKVLGSFTFVSEFTVIRIVELVIVVKHTFIQ